MAQAANAASLTGELTALLADITPGSLAPTSAYAAKRVLLDAVGVMMAASGMVREVDPFVSFARTMGEGPCGVLGTSHKVSPVMAALANGAMAHALDYEDAFDLAPGHPNASLVPALLALAQCRGPVDGRRLMASLVAGCELACRMGLALQQKLEVAGWYPPPILAGYGATLGAAHLLGLDPQRMADALSLALCQITMPGEIKHSERTVIRAVREAFPAQAAVQSALLAEKGLAGFEQPLEGTSGFYALYAGGKFDRDVLLAPFDGHAWIEQLTFKPWPSCRGTHPYIEMALAMKQQHGFAAADITAVTVGVGPMQRMLVEPVVRKQAPAVAIDAKFSVPFCTASALVNNTIDLDSFGEDRLRDPVVLALAAKVDFEQPPGSGHWRGDAGTLAIVLADGRRLEAVLDRARGTADNPLSEEQMIGKFVECAGRAAVPFPAAEAQDLAARIMTLEECSDVGALFQR